MMFTMGVCCALCTEPMLCINVRMFINVDSEIELYILNIFITTIELDKLELGYYVVITWLLQKLFA